MTELRHTPVPAGDMSQSVAFFMVVDDRLSRPVAIERPDSLVVIMHLRRGITTATASRYGCLLLDPIEQIPWRRAFDVPLDPAMNPMDYLAPHLRDLIAAPEVIPPEVALPE